jgi:hypothetical protein
MFSREESSTIHLLFMKQIDSGTTELHNVIRELYSVVWCPVPAKIFEDSPSSPAVWWVEVGGFSKTLVTNYHTKRRHIS